MVLHFAQDNPRSDVSVIVITTMSKNAKPLNNYLFQVVVSKVTIQDLKFSKFFLGIYKIMYKFFYGNGFL